MRLILAGFVIGALATGNAAAQGGWTPQASPAPAPPPPVYVPPVAAPSAPKSKASPPVPSQRPNSWFTEDDYPAASLRADESGSVSFTLAVDAQGRVSGCTITQSSGHELLDQTTCRLLTERATFYPARDKKGKPTSGTWSNRFNWVLPVEFAPQEIVPVEAIESFFVEADGSISGCHTVVNGKEMDADQARNACATGARVKPFTDANGKPVRRKVNMKMSITVESVTP